ncbi:MAG: CRISPR-associated protein Csx15 [Candidatus Lokiarchaeia archaeon]
MTEYVIWLVAVEKLISAIKKYKEKKKSKLELKNELLDFVLINLSRHPLAKETKEEVLNWGKCKIIERNIPALDLSNPITYMDNVIKFCADTLHELVSKEGLLKTIQLGKYILIPPGMNSIAITFTTMLHGIAGHFPEMSFFYQQDKIFNLIKPHNFQNLRIQYRNIQATKNMKKNIEQEYIAIILSGYPLSPEAISKIKRWGDYKIIEKIIPNIDLSNPLTYMDNVIKYCSETIDDLIENEGILKHLKLGKVIIIPSGMTSIILTFVSIFHGIIGHFPRMSFLYKKDIFDLTELFDFYSLREKLRDKL